MTCFDSSFLIDYLEGTEDALTYIDAHPDDSFYVPNVVLFELYRGAIRTSRRNAVAELRNDLSWLEPLPFTADAALEAAKIEAELKQDGTPIGTPDVQIAGIVRNIGETLVTRDRDFDEVEGLNVESYP
ncbi:type II toxin-antitoxin system VapC family toxin [Halorussus pelagicus]|uniref:type II toxin-antitoxin system VapC family toxin n=1 Tax=Halorussus pelagicus TaxID=2505977 RepID=UPI000FFC8DB3